MSSVEFPRGIRSGFAANDWIDGGGFTTSAERVATATKPSASVTRTVGEKVPTPSGEQARRGPSVSPALACRPAATGNFTIGVTVTDADGIEAVASVLLAVTTPVPASPTHGGAPGTPSWEWALLGVAGVAALAVGIVVGLRRRRVA